MPIPIFIPDFRPYSNIEPFTVRAGTTHMLKIEEYLKWVRDTLVPHIDKEIEGLSESWAENTAALIEVWNNTRDEVLARIDEAEASIGTAVDDANAAKAAAEAARDMAELFASQAQEIQDIAISTIINDSNSETFTLLSDLFASVESVTTLENVVQAITEDVATKASQFDFDSFVSSAGAMIDDLYEVKADRSVVEDLSETLEDVSEIVAKNELVNFPSDAIPTVGTRRVKVSNGVHSAFPSQVILPDGRFFMVYREASAEVATVVGKIMGTWSSDAGNTWTSPVVLFSDAMDLRDPHVSVIRGKVMITLFKHDSINPVGVWIAESEDGGASWNALQRIDGAQRAAVCAPAVEHNGNIFIPYYGKQSLGEARDSSYVLRSSDGSSWDTFTIATSSQRDYQEPNMVAMSGKLVSMFRYGAALSLGRSESTNNGQSWSSATSVINGAGGKPALIVDQGNLLVTYRQLSDGAVATRISTNQGNSFGDAIIIDRAPQTMAYASVVALAPGRLGVAYALQSVMGSATVTGDCDIYYRWLMLSAGTTPFGDYVYPISVSVDMPLPPTVYDAFTRPDGPLGTSTSGSVWESQGVALSAGKAYGSVTPGVSWAVINSSSNDADIRARMRLGGTGGAGLIARFINSTNYLMFVYESVGVNARLYKVQGGTATMLKEVSAVDDARARVKVYAETEIRLKLDQEMIRCYVDGYEVMAHYLSGVDMLAFLDATKHGIRINRQDAAQHTFNRISIK